MPLTALRDIMAAVMNVDQLRKFNFTLIKNTQKHAALNGTFNLPLNAPCRISNVPFPLHG